MTDISGYQLKDPLKKLYIEPTSDCNLDCKMCFRHTWFDEEPGHMTYANFEKTLATMPKEVETIFFGGMGEPLHHPDIIKMVEESSNKGVRVEVLTNGTLLDDTMSKALMDAGLNRLWVSMDSIEPMEDHGLGHPNYDRLIEHIKVFNLIRRDHPRNVTLGITFVANKSNVHQLANLPFFLDRFEVSETNISNMYPSDEASQEETLYQRTLNMSIASDAFGSTRPIVNLPFMDFDLPQVQEGLKGLFTKMNFNLQVSNTDVPRRSQYCRFVNEGMTFVRSDGHVSPCMALLHSGKTVLSDVERTIHHHSFGDVGEEGLKTIWESEDYSAFRAKVKAFEFSPCMTCGLCTYTEDNEEDCFGNEKPTCGACLWAEGLLSCP